VTNLVADYEKTEKNKQKQNREQKTRKRKVHIYKVQIVFYIFIKLLVTNDEKLMRENNRR
jgi:hypothetical protein